MSTSSRGCTRRRRRGIADLTAIVTATLLLWDQLDANPRVASVVPAVFEVGLVTRERDDHVLVSSALQLLDPRLGAAEGFLERAVNIAACCSAAVKN